MSFPWLCLRCGCRLTRVRNRLRQTAQQAVQRLVVSIASPNGRESRHARPSWHRRRCTSRARSWIIGTLNPRPAKVGGSVPVQPLLTAKLGDEYAMPFIVPGQPGLMNSHPYLECRAALCSACFSSAMSTFILSRRHQCRTARSARLAFGKRLNANVRRIQVAQLSEGGNCPFAGHLAGCTVPDRHGVSLKIFTHRSVASSYASQPVAFRIVCSFRPPITFGCIDAQTVAL